MGFSALASTSSGFAWTIGRPDYGVARADVLDHLSRLCAAVDLPVNADFESGFADDPAGVAASVGLAIEAGVAGLSIEDRGRERRSTTSRRRSNGSARRARRSRRPAATRSSSPAPKSCWTTPTQVAAAIDKLVAFAAAGADCLYAPGVRKTDDIRAMVASRRAEPLNVLVMDPVMTLQAFADLGVRRVSVGGSLARVGWGAVLAAAKQLRQGSFDGLAGGAPSRELNEAFRATR